MTKYDWPLNESLCDFSHRGMRFSAVMQRPSTRNAVELIVMCSTESAHKIGDASSVAKALAAAASVFAKTVTS